MRRSYVYELVLAAMFAVIIAICAWITIPFAIPFTMQTFGVFLALSVLGGKWGTISIFIYILLGIIGIPVFSGFQGGIGIIFSNTGGYILGFLAAALVIWGMEYVLGKKPWMRMVGMFLGLLICYGFGTWWFLLLYTKNTGTLSIFTVLSICVFPFVIPDMIKIFFALAVRKRFMAII